MSVVLCLPAHLRVSRSVPWPAPHGNASAPAPVAYDTVTIGITNPASARRIACSTHINGTNPLRRLQQPPRRHHQHLHHPLHRPQCPNPTHHSFGAHIPNTPPHPTHTNQPHLHEPSHTEKWGAHRPNGPRHEHTHTPARARPRHPGATQEPRPPTQAPRHHCANHPPPAPPGPAFQKPKATR